MRISMLLLLVVGPFCGSAFIFEKPLADIKKVVEAQHQERLSFGLNIGKPGDISRLPIQGIEFDLTKHTPKSTDDFVKMPGAHGPPQLRYLSGGVHTLSVVSNGSFVSMAGSEIVEVLKGCWEIIWKDGDPSGSLLCGFEVDQDYKRNDAILPKGNVYVSFNAWTSEGLEQAQQRKTRIMKLATTALEKKQEELDMMKKTSNLIQKAIHFYNAINAVEDYTLLPVKTVESIPDPDSVVHFKGDLFLSTKGMVWRRDDSNGKPTVIGNALMNST
ncbi:unnamed protein product [Pseudo-nitzschia multistriata]|uniref:Uncharacterized protein n=1 Tax=Pseudo-nitzschia multistriata TaxID=183589 RepID=A0A448Z6C2_9STRA|nr:unnamed protein product [Pseudo-nitzschia multistriata]